MKRWMICLLTVTVPLTAGAQVYRWVDKDGKVTYSDTPPPTGAVQTPKLSGNQVEVDKMSFETKRAVANAPVTLFSAENCKELCERARKLLTDRKVPFSETAVKTPDEAAAAAKRLGGDVQVPSMMVGSKPLIGFESGQWTAALDAAGYPPSGR
ncbi:glutaredoxin family protein [Uliginosibacterium sp. H1]|uniref:glutaredoxin family protein n=1 Tax=Uliginosibacterium sp. H1 TaxID=3114757 RepID=UPI002E178AAE|nr:glutaredoxin family protein [Uliginosibacterium sp. H1]